MITLPAHPRILVVALRRIGDVLLTTPLIRSLRRAWPDAQIDVLAFADTAAILKGNPDISSVIAMPARPGASATVSLLLRLTRRYALAISTQTGDRPMLFALLAGRVSVAPMGQGGAMAAFKRTLKMELFFLAETAIEETTAAYVAISRIRPPGTLC